MTETEWLGCTDPTAMRDFVWRKAAFRKRCLFYAAAGRLVWPILPNDRCRRCVEVVERFADDKSAREEFLGYVDVLTPAWTVAERHEHAARVRLMQDIFGNPFRPVAIDPVCITPKVAALARTIYDDRTFDRLPELANLLESVGCSYPDILTHCRGEGPHVRGCWVVDLILGKE